MSDTTERPDLVDLLPMPPYDVDEDGYSIDGYEWMGVVYDAGIFGRACGTPHWYVVAEWGTEGWNLGHWPYKIALHYDDPDTAYALAEYVEGDLFVKAYATRAERDAATDRYLIHCLNYLEVKGLDDLPAEGEPIPARYCGPYQGR